MKDSIKRTQKEIDKVLEKAAASDKTRYPEMTYEDGIEAFAQWLFGYWKESPFCD